MNARQGDWPVVGTAKKGDRHTSSNLKAVCRSPFLKTEATLALNYSSGNFQVRKDREMDLGLICPQWADGGTMTKTAPP